MPGMFAFALCVMIAPARVSRGEETNELWFPVGEELEYTLYWGILPVGEARVTSGWMEEDGKRLVVLRLTAQTGPIVSRIYPVKDVAESVVDPGTFLPVRFTQKISEGKKVRNDTIVFNHTGLVAACFFSSGNVTTNMPIEADTRDLISFVYYMRSKGFDAGNTEKFKVLVDDDIYEMSVTGLEKEDIFLSHFGYVRCLELEPQAKFGELFVRKGKLNVWFSDDARKVCCMLVGVVPVANVKAMLQGVKGPGGDFWTSGKKRKKPSRKQAAGK